MKEGYAIEEDVWAVCLTPGGGDNWPGSDLTKRSEINEGRNHHGTASEKGGPAQAAHHRLGRDLEDWFKAEFEILHPAHVDLTETDGELRVRAEVPGFTEKDLEVGVEPRHLTIIGKRESNEQRKRGRTVYSEQCSNQILRALELPVVVDTQKVTSTIEDGILELVIPKAASARKLRIETKAA